MAGYYDPNKDYSKAISEAKAAGKDTSQLEAERQNKINDKYGGKEPNMWGSDKTYSQASRDNDRDTISNAISIRNSRNNQSGGSSAGTSSVGAVTTPSTTWQPGILTKGNRPDTSKHPEYAGLSVKQGHYTVTYNNLGYAVKAVNDDGASANATMKTTHANDSIYHQEAYQAAQRGDWDAVGTAINKIAMAEGKDQYGYDMTNANRYYGELVNEFRYNANDYYNKRYDETFGAGSAAAWDATNGAIKTYKDLENAIGPDKAAQLLASKQAGTQATSPAYQELTPVSPQSGGGFTANLGGSYGGGYGSDISDASQYLRDMYAQQIAAELASLKSTYEQNLADISTQDDLISSAYAQQRNQAAAQNDLQRMQMNEYGIMRGLSSGASGQMALAQSAALQGSLAQLGTQEAQSLSDNALSRQKLTIAYRNAADQAAAEGNAKLASALYEEYVRQQELALQQQAAAQEQANWEAKMAYQQQQDAIAQQNWQAQFDYQKAQDDLNYQLTLQKLYGSSAGNTDSTVRTRTPVKAKSVGYNNGNLTNEQVKVLQNHYGVTADGLWGKNSSNAAGGLTAAQAWDAFQSGPLKSIEQSVGMNRTSTGQANAIQKALQAGSITEAQAEAMLRKFGIM